MPLSRQALARVLAEKSKLIQSPALNNPMAKPANTLQANPLAIPNATATPMMPSSPSVLAPGFKPPRFGNLKAKLRF